MGFIYLLMSYLGYFLVLIIFLAIAVGCAKQKAAWPLYFIGAGIQLLALIGNSRSGAMMGPYWFIYGLLLALAAWLIRRRREDYE